MKAYLHRNGDVAGRLVSDVLNGLAMLHGRRIVHGDLHTDNIMVRDGKVFFLDFGDAFFSDDFALDKDGLENPAAFRIVEKIYGSWGISWVFNLFNAPAMQYVVYSILGVATSLSSLVSKYGCITAF